MFWICQNRIQVEPLSPLAFNSESYVKDHGGLYYGEEMWIAWRWTGVIDSRNVSGYSKVVVSCAV